MTQIHLVRQDNEMSEQERGQFFSLLLRLVDGLGDLHRKRVRRFFNWLFKLDVGEMATIDVIQPRSGQFHKFHMKLESSVFEGQERIQHFEQFRYWIKVGAGFVDWLKGPSGGVVPVPRSISYAELAEPEYREFHDEVLKFLRGPHAAKYLWPHLTGQQAAEMMESILGGFE